MSTPELTRRGALGGVLAGVALSGCDLVSPGPDPDAPSTGAPDDTGGQAPEDPDLALVDSVRAALAEASALVAAAVAARPTLGPELAGLRRLHRRHLAALPGDAAEQPRPSVAGDAARVRSRVRSREEQLQARLADAAVASESGPLAALFASMSAAVAQQLAVPSPAGRR